jgi:hypothetical protein
MRYLRWACAMLLAVSASPIIILICCLKAVLGIPMA